MGMKSVRDVICASATGLELAAVGENEADTALWREGRNRDWVGARRTGGKRFAPDTVLRTVSALSRCVSRIDGIGLPSSRRP